MWWIFDCKARGLSLVSAFCCFFPQTKNFTPSYLVPTQVYIKIVIFSLDNVSLSNQVHEWGVTLTSIPPN